MEIEKKPKKKFPDTKLVVTSQSSMVFLLVIFYTFSFSTIAFSEFIPTDNFLIDCGADKPVTHIDGRIFKTEENFLQTKEEIKVLVENADALSPIDLSGSIFVEEATYSFNISSPGWHWVRLHFYPLNNERYDLRLASFSVQTDKYVLLQRFQTKEYSFKEYLLNITEAPFIIKFIPMKKSVAFINAIEVISGPNNMFESTAPFAFETVYRLNVGGPLLTSRSDWLGRTWSPDERYIESENLVKRVSVQSNVIKYVQGTSPIFAPPEVYATAVVPDHKNTNLTWRFEADKAFGHLIRLHFCEIQRTALGEHFFNVYLNLKRALLDLNLAGITSGLSTAYFSDVILNSTAMSNGLTVQIGPSVLDRDIKSPILNGLEILKMSNSADSLDGALSINAAKTDSRNIVLKLGLVLVVGACLGLGAMVIKWYQNPESFSSWLLPLPRGDVGRKKLMRPRRFKGLGRYFSYGELMAATNDFDQAAVIGVGGFGNVYIGTLRGQSVAVKRGNPQSQQGVTEFETEILLLGKVRHIHVVSLIGYCNDMCELILIYEYMSNGSLQDHLIGKKFPVLSWKQRLEICIGAAKGLHYLHTGTQQGIIHRDVKSSNILLDENLVAKVADFGLSKEGATDKSYVSTAVKGSFGYLDPEYFKTNKLSIKSDTYAFGVVLLETICARPAIDNTLPREEMNLADWALMQWKKDLLHKIVDPPLRGSYSAESMKTFITTAESCLAESGEDRPHMGDVLWNLEQALQLQEASQGTSTSHISIC